MNNGLPAPNQPVTPDNERFWDATDEGVLLIKHCPACEEHHYPPRPHCPHCHHPETRWIEAAGLGTIYSFTVTRQAHGQFGDVTPYILTYVQLSEGPRMLTNVVDCDPSDVEIGDKVEVVFHDTGGDTALPRFRPV